MGLFKKAKKFVKKVGRKVATVHAKAAKIVTPIVSAAATIALGPAAGAAVAAVAGTVARYQGATAARAKGLKGHAAREKGRELRKDVIKLGLIGTGAGVAVNAGIAAITGQNVLKSAALGQAGGKLLGISNTPDPTATSPESAIPGLLTQNSLTSGDGGGLGPIPGIVTRDVLDASNKSAGGQGGILDILGGILNPTDSENPTKVPVDTDGDGVPDSPAEGFFNSPVKIALAGGAVIAGVMLLRRAG